MGGLRQGSKDYKTIWKKFLAGDEGYDYDNYDGDDIFAADEVFKARYKSKDFKASLGRMTEKIRQFKKEMGDVLGDAGEEKEPMDEDNNGDEMPSEVPPTPAPAPAPKKSKAAKKTPETPKPTTRPKTGTPNTAPFKSPESVAAAGIPVDYAELVSNDEFVLDVPHILFGWKDVSENDRLTLVVYLPLGVKAEQVTARIEAGGTQVSVEMVWPGLMQNGLLAMYAGTTGSKPYYHKGHVKVSSFRSAVKALKGEDESQVLKSVFRCNLTSTVEEQFSKYDVPDSVVTVGYTIPAYQDPNPDEPRSEEQEALALVLEMMCTRSNYGAASSVRNFTCDFSKLKL